MFRMMPIVACATILVAGCASVSVVSKSPDRIAIVANNSHELDNAHRKAEHYCHQNGLTAKLDHTENVDRGAVAYFDCM